ncbi:MAG TPA: hypothetical protein VIF15_20680 [Polyangiaceae bacterium]|jgi:hypothetical protein
MELILPRTMRGEDKKQSSMLVLMSPETRVPQTHPLRAIKRLADATLATLSRLLTPPASGAAGRPATLPTKSASSAAC